MITAQEARIAANAAKSMAPLESALDYIAKRSAAGGYATVLRGPIWSEPVGHAEADAIRQELINRGYTVTVHMNAVRETLETQVAW